MLPDGSQASRTRESQDRHDCHAHQMHQMFKLLGRSHWFAHHITQPELPERTLCQWSSVASHGGDWTSHWLVNKVSQSQTKSKFGWWLDFWAGIAGCMESVLTWPHTWSGPTFCPVGISSPIWTQKLWNFKYALYSMLCTYSRCFFEPNCFERNEEIWAVVTLAVGIWMANTLTTWQISTVYATFDAWQWCDWTEGGSGPCVGSC